MSLFTASVAMPPAVSVAKETPRPPATRAAAAASGLLAFSVAMAAMRVVTSPPEVITVPLRKVPPFDSGIVMPPMTRLATELLVISTFVSEAASSLPEPSKASARTKMPPAPAVNGLTVIACTCLKMGIRTVLPL
ncbi:hypothetical protein HPGCJGGD_3738 [Methylobacterium haplocladii]|nr:hypothetical protein HPGCJGGD_3738 [Methylobacterium haplocladii]